MARGGFCRITSGRGARVSREFGCIVAGLRRAMRPVTRLCGSGLGGAERTTTVRRIIVGQTGTRLVLEKPYCMLILDEEEEYEELIAELSEVIRRQPEHGVALNNRGVAYMEVGRLRDALEDFRRSAAALPSSGVPLHNSARIHVREGDLETGLHDYAEAIAREPNDVRLRRARGHVFHSAGRFAEAIADYDVAIALDPTFERTARDRERAVGCEQPEA